MSQRIYMAREDGGRSDAVYTSSVPFWTEGRPICGGFLLENQQFAPIQGVSNTPLQLLYYAEEHVGIVLYRESVCLFPGKNPVWQIVSSADDNVSQHVLTSHATRGESRQNGVRNLHPLHVWRPSDDQPKECGFFERVGYFTSMAFEPSNNFLFIGTDKGCVVVFLLEFAPSIVPETETSHRKHPDGEGFDFLSDRGINSQRGPYCSLRPFLWTDLSKFVDGAEGDIFLEDVPISIASLVVCGTGNDLADAIQAAEPSASGDHSESLPQDRPAVAAVLLSSGYLAVLYVDAKAGLIPVDVLQLPCVPKKTAIRQAGQVGDYWSVEIAMASDDAVILLQATRDTVLLTHTIDVNLHFSALWDMYPAVGLPPSSPNHPEATLMALDFGIVHGSCVVMGAWSVELPGSSHHAIELLTFNSESRLCHAERAGVDGSLQDIVFLIGLCPAITALKAVNMLDGVDESLYGLCVITSNSLSVLSLPHLHVVHRLVFSHSSNDKERLSVCGVCSTVEIRQGARGQRKLRQRLLDILEDADPHGVLQSESTLALMLGGPRSSQETESLLPIVWLIQRQLTRYRGDTLNDAHKITEKPSSEDLVEGSVNVQERLARLKHEIECSIQRAKQEPAEFSSNPEILLNMFRTLLVLAEESEGASRNLLPYIASTARVAPFNTVSATRHLLTGTAELLRNAENTGGTDGVRGSAISVLKALQRLATFSLLCRVTETGGDEGSSDSPFPGTIFSEKPPKQEDQLQWDASGLTFDWTAWNRFLKADLAKLCCAYAGAGDIAKAVLIFNRHAPEFDRDDDMRSEKVMKILMAFPTQLGTSPTLESFFGDWVRSEAVPLLRNSFALIEWLSGRAMALEALWSDPLPALGFLRAVFGETKLVTVKESAPSLGCGKQLASDSVWLRGGCSIPSWETLPMLPGDFVSLAAFWNGCCCVLGDLSTAAFPGNGSSTTNRRRPIEQATASKRRKALERLTRVYCLLAEGAHILERHSVRVRLADLECGRVSWTDVAYELLNRVRLHELLQDEVRLHVEPFCVSHGLDLEVVLLSYIHDVVRGLMPLAMVTKDFILNSKLLLCARGCGFGCGGLPVYQVVDMDTDSLDDETVNVYGRDREQRAVALIECLRLNESKVRALLWLLHAWNPSYGGSASVHNTTSKSLGQLIASLQESSRVMAGNPVFHTLQSAIALRDIQFLLSKYNIRANLTTLSKPSDARCLVTHLASLISWNAVSFQDALTVVRILSPVVPHLGLDAVAVAMTRLQTLTSPANKPMMTQLVNGLRLGLCSSNHESRGGVSQPVVSSLAAAANASEAFKTHTGPFMTGAWTWKAYESWEASWKPAYLRLLQDTVIAHLCPAHIGILSEEFAAYGFLVLDAASDVLQGERVDSRDTFSCSLSTLLTVAEAILVSLAAISLLQHHETHTLSRQAGGSIPSVTSKMVPSDVTRRTLGRPSVLEVFQRCERLRREFGLFVKPSALSEVAVTNKFDNISGCPRKRTASVSEAVRLSSAWKTTVNSTNLFAIRNLFSALGTKHIEDAAYGLSTSSARSGAIVAQMTEERRTGGALSSIASSSGLSTAQFLRSSNFTRLLQFGVLMGVGESYVRQSVVKPTAVAEKKLLMVDTQSLQRLLTDVKRNPSSENAADTMTMVRVILEQLLRRADDSRLGVVLLASLSQILDVASHCLRALRPCELPNGVRLACDVLLVLRLLLQSDLLDTAVDAGLMRDRWRGFGENRPPAFSPIGAIYAPTELGCFSTFARAFLPHLGDFPSAQPSRLSACEGPFSDVVPCAPSSAASVVYCAPHGGSDLLVDETLFSKSVFEGRFRDISALYPKKDALNDAVLLLALQNEISASSSVTSGFLGEAMSSVTKANDRLCVLVANIVARLLDHESYELALSFLLRFPCVSQSNAKVKEAAAHLLTKVTASRTSCDFELGVGLCLLLGRKEVWIRFVDALPGIREVPRVLFYSRLVMDIGILFRNTRLVQNTMKVWVRAKWREQLDDLQCHYDVRRFQEVHEEDPNKGAVAGDGGLKSCQRELLPHLLAMSNLDLPLARRFAEDFDIPEEDVLSLWLKLLLVTPEEQLRTPETVNSGHYLSYRQLTLPVLYSLARDTVDRILEHECLPLISPYDYDRIEFVLSWIAHRPVAKAGLVIIHYIRSYRRTHPPTEMELQWCQSLCGRDLTQEEKWLQRERLPFHLLLESPWDILGPAVTDATINTFMPMYPLRLRRDDFQLQLLWNFIEDLQMGSVSGSQWSLPSSLDRRAHKGSPVSTTSPFSFASCFNGQDALAVSEKQAYFAAMTCKLKELLDNAVTVHPKRAVAAAFLLLEHTELLSMGPLQVAIAKWVSVKLTAGLLLKNDGEASSVISSSQPAECAEQDRGRSSPHDVLSIDLRDGLPPYSPPSLRKFLAQHNISAWENGATRKRLENTPHPHTSSTATIASNTRQGLQQKASCVTPGGSSELFASPFWIIKRSRREASREAGIRRARWALIQCGLGHFAELLPHCSLLCVHALYYYLAPILMRPTPHTLHSQMQKEIFSTLSQYPAAQLPSACSNPAEASSSPMAEGWLNSGAALDSFQRLSIHELVDLICFSCDFNPKVVRLLLLRRFLKTPFWSPLNCVDLLERNMTVYKEQDVIGMIGSLPTAHILASARAILCTLEAGPLTEGFARKWFAPFSPQTTTTTTATATTTTNILSDIGLTMGQSDVELLATQRQNLILLGTDGKSYMKLILETALKNDRTLSTSSRALYLLYTTESIEAVHGVYRETPEKTFQFWKHSLYLDAFDKIGIASQFGNFIKADKAGLIRAFWRQSRASPPSDVHHTYLLVLIAALYVDFRIQDQRLLARVLLKLLAFSRPPVSAFAPNNAASIQAIQGRTPTQKNSAAVSALAAQFLKTILCWLFARHAHNLVSSEPEFINALQELLCAPQTDLMAFLRGLQDFHGKPNQVPPAGGSHGGPALPQPEIPATSKWLLHVPAFLHRSPLLCVHDVTAIARPYYEMAHYLNHVHAQLTDAVDVVVVAESHHPRFSSYPAAASAASVSLWASRATPVGGGENPLASGSSVFFSWAARTLTALDEEWCRSYEVRWMFGAWGLGWLLQASPPSSRSEAADVAACGQATVRVPHGVQTPDRESEDLQRERSASFSLSLVRLQIISVAMGLQCLSSGVEPMPETHPFLESLRSDLRGSIPALSFLLQRASGLARHVETASLLSTVEKILASKPTTRSMVARFLGMVEASKSHTTEIPGVKSKDQFPLAA